MPSEYKTKYLVGVGLLMPDTNHFAFADGVHDIDFYLRQFRADRLAKHYSTDGRAKIIIEKYYDGKFKIGFEVANDNFKSMVGKWNGRVTITTGENTTHITLEGVSRSKNLTEVCGGTPLSWKVIRDHHGERKFVFSRDMNDVPAFGDEITARISD